MHGILRRIWKKGKSPSHGELEKQFYYPRRMINLGQNCQEYNFDKRQRERGIFSFFHILLRIPCIHERTCEHFFVNHIGTNVSGKMFLQVLANRLLSYMVQNNYRIYIDQAIQKGFYQGLLVVLNTLRQ